MSQWWAVLACGLAWGAMITGCASHPAPQVAAPAAPVEARLLVENLTDYDWRLAIAAVAGGRDSAAHVPARGTIEIKLLGGDYVIEQAVVSQNAGPSLARRIPARLESGQTYRWRLVTLLSDPGGAAARERP